MKEISFYHDIEQKPWKCSGVTITLRDDKTIVFGTIKGVQCLKHGTAVFDRPVRKIRLDERKDISALGSSLHVRFEDVD